MSIALIVLSLAVAALIVACALLSFVLIDSKATANFVTNMLREREESCYRMQALVLEKFNYHVPMSDKYLSLEELLHEKSKREEK